MEGGDHHHLDHIHEIFELTRWERLKCYLSTKYKVYKYICGSKKVMKSIEDIKSSTASLNAEFNTHNVLLLLQQVKANLADNKIQDK